MKGAVLLQRALRTRSCFEKDQSKILLHVFVTVILLGMLFANINDIFCPN